MIPRIVPFVDHEIGYRILEKLISYVDAGKIEIPVVVTTRENGVAWWPSVDQLCARADIQLLIYEEQIYENSWLQNTDWFLLLSWKHVIPVNLINVPKQGVLNLHYSLLPDLRGVYPVNWAIINGLDVTGVSYHLVNEDIDSGEVLIQTPVEILLNDTARTLQARMDDVAYDSFDKLLEQLVWHPSLTGIQQSVSQHNTSENYYSRTKFEIACEIDLNKSYKGKEIYDLLRGLTFFPDSKNAYVLDHTTGKKIYISFTFIED
ncbi:formyltransferase family protein [Neptuniibacter sp.]|uniref:formyltransferase family protein n=1 Tax=Neptuniibacter sp. TaxID=1962643 RepID=UPI003B5C3BF7